MKFIKRILPVLLLMFFAFSMSAYVPQDQKKGAPWNVPEKYQKMTNPFADNTKLVKIGKMLYSKHCKSCHGNNGLGDGPKAKKLDTFPGDFSTDEFQNMNDGELYYKSIFGRDDMPNYEDKIPDEEDRWSVIMYMNSAFKK